MTVSVVTGAMRVWLKNYCHNNYYESNFHSYASCIVLNLLCELGNWLKVARPWPLCFLRPWIIHAEYMNRNVWHKIILFTFCHSRQYKVN